MARRARLGWDSSRSDSRDVREGRARVRVAPRASVEVEVRVRPSRQSTRRRRRRGDDVSRESENFFLDGTARTWSLLFSASSQCSRAPSGVVVGPRRHVSARAPHHPRSRARRLRLVPSRALSLPAQAREAYISPVQDDRAAASARAKLRDDMRRQVRRVESRPFLHEEWFFVADAVRRADILADAPLPDADDSHASPDATLWERDGPRPPRAFHHGGIQAQTPPPRGCPTPRVHPRRRLPPRIRLGRGERARRPPVRGVRRRSRTRDPPPPSSRDVSPPSSVCRPSTNPRSSDSSPTRWRAPPRRISQTRARPVVLVVLVV